MDIIFETRNNKPSLKNYSNYKKKNGNAEIG